MIKQFTAYNERYQLIKKGDSIVVGVSGGADSVCLLSLLDELAGEWQLSLYVLHVHHGIRGKEADRDRDFVRKLAKERGLPFCAVETSVPEEAKKRGMTEEEAGRAVRYEALESFRAEHALDCIAVAHNRDDQAETVLFRLFRGSGPRGLAGIPVRRGCIVRPLLFADRQQIEDYLNQRGQQWCADSTNGELRYTRNCIRHTVIPLAGRLINSRAGDHIAGMAEKMAQWRSYERTALRKENTVTLPTEALRAEDIVIRGEACRLALSDLIPGAKDIGQIHYEKLQQLLEAGAGTRLTLPGGVMAERQYDAIVITKNPGGPGDWGEKIAEFPSVHTVQMPGGRYRIRFEIVGREELPEEIPQKDYTKWLDYDMIKDGLELRNPREGDFFVSDDTGHRKKLSRYYIDRKIPRSQRPEQLVLADGNHVLWAFPDRISAACKIRENTKKVLVVTREREPS